MNTPAHVVINLLFLGTRSPTLRLTPVVLGGILPDTPMFLFYFVEKVVRQTPESVIWRESYPQAHWQNLIDLFHSFPLMAIGLLVALRVGSRFGALLFGSMVLHGIGDFPLHHEDAHRHFFPLSNWRFYSPVSYWDAHHYGQWVSVLEMITVGVGCMILFQRYDTRPSKITIGLMGTGYWVYLIYVFIVWA